MTELKNAAEHYGWQYEHTAAEAPVFALTNAFLAGAAWQLERIERAGCPHACSPPCPFHRRMKEFTPSDDVAEEKKK